MIRYLAVIGIDLNEQFEKSIETELKSRVLCLEEKPTDTPYVKLRIKIIEREPRYKRDRTGKIKSVKKGRRPWQRKGRGQ